MPEEDRSFIPRDRVRQFVMHPYLIFAAIQITWEQEELFNIVIIQQSNLIKGSAAFSLLSLYWCVFL